MRIAVCWTDVSGYMAACWRALAARTGVELLVLTFAPDAAADVAFRCEELLEGLPHRLLAPGERDDEALVARTVIDHRPDVVLVAGWLHPAYRALPARRELGAARFVLGMDTQRRHGWRQFAGRWLRRRFLHRFHAAMVAGERSWQLARHLGFPEGRIVRGVYGIDRDRFAGCWRRRSAGPWPRSFCFVGRYIPQKGLDVLIDAYRSYRATFSDPWPLRCCGQGSLGDALEREAGVANMGFVQPDDLPDVLVEQGALVMPSRFEPWGQAIVEAAAAGLPVVCSEACGASVEVVRSFHNGLTVPTGDAGRLARALGWIHRNHERLPELGRRSMALAEPYAAERWADRLIEAAED